jgi:Holliday junction resolvasome RuvABC ATP-dependent DNA helicase subunit
VCKRARRSTRENPNTANRIMAKIKCFQEVNSKDIEETVNAWLEANPGIDVLKMEHSGTTHMERGFMSIVFLYNEKIEFEKV